MPKHITRLVGVLVIAFVVLIAARNQLVVRSYYDYGAYRGDSVAEIASDPVKIAQSSYYESFYPVVYATWAAGIHKPVQCPVCHGPAALGSTVKVEKPTNSAEICTTCHARTAGRPASQPQVVVEKHAGRQQCVNCHDPHSPLLRSSGKSIVAEVTDSAGEGDDFGMSAGGGTPAKEAKKAPLGNATVGHAKAALCTTCHGVGKVVRSVSAGPNLAGQTDDHIAAELRAFQVDKRSSAVMGPIAKGLNADEINDIAAYFAIAASKK